MSKIKNFKYLVDEVSDVEEYLERKKSDYAYYKEEVATTEEQKDEYTEMIKTCDKIIEILERAVIK